MNWHAGWPTPGHDHRAPDPDADQDTLPDEWELRHGLDPHLPTGPDGPEGDPDNDGLPNRLEFALETNPRGKELVLASVTVAADGVFLTFNSIEGRSYAIETRDALGSGEWRHLTNLLPTSTSRMVELKLPLDAGSLSRYYRVRLP